MYRVTESATSTVQLGGSPVVGLKDFKAGTLRAAIAQLDVPPHEDLGQRLQGCVELAYSFASNKKGLSMSREEMAAINLFTQGTQLHTALNEALRADTRIFLEPFMPFLRLLLGGLYQLPLQPTKVFHGARADMTGIYKKGKNVIWLSVVSAIKTDTLLTSEPFLGSEGPRTLFGIQAFGLVNVSAFSTTNFDEYILLPGSTLIVDDVVDLGGGLKRIELSQDQAPFLFDYVHPDLESVGYGFDV